MTGALIGAAAGALEDGIGGAAVGAVAGSAVGAGAGALGGANDSTKHKLSCYANAYKIKVTPFTTLIKN